jgi:TDG/mug DNA glycosylase family protein
MKARRASGQPWRPTPEQLEAARDGTVPDVVEPGLRVLFVGINPGLYSAAVRHHFARPGNRFWKALAAAGFTDEVLSPFEEGELLALRLGVTNIVGRATARADELSREELRRGADSLARKVKRLRPGVVAFLGITAYRTAFRKPGATPGPRPEPMGVSTVWLLPNPSGLNAHHQLEDLARAFRELRIAAGG